MARQRRCILAIVRPPLSRRLDAHLSKADEINSGIRTQQTTVTLPREEKKSKPRGASPLPPPPSHTPNPLYLDLLEAAVCGRLIEDPSIHPAQEGYDADRRLRGWDWPQYAHTMIGVQRVRNLRVAVERVLQDGVPGDLLETGVWRGGACILMRGILAAYGVADRKVWVCDSFQGLPPPNTELYPADAGDKTHAFPELRISIAEVRHNFSKYGLLDDQVVFVEGWFRDTLQHVATEKLAVLRLDGDMYESTMDALNGLYHKLSPGGFLIVDDYVLPACRKATEDFRSQHEIVEPIEIIDGVGAFWRRERP